QAVIAIENVRLFDEVQARTRELSESLEQQTATSEVLKVISSSPGELEPVFQAILANATQICAANFGNLLLYEGEVFRRVAMHNAPQAIVDAHQRDERIVPRRSAPALDRLARTKEAIHIIDLAAECPSEPILKLASARTLLLVPMLKESELIGAIGIYRQEVLPFTDKQIELVRNFAAQAVIAIENTRLLNELRQRTDDLSEALEQQTATAEVLKVISSSPGALEPVFQAMLGNALHICESKFGIMYRFSDGIFQALSSLGNPPAYLIEHPHIVSEHPHNPLTLLATTKEPIHISDLFTERSYIERNPRMVALTESAGARSIVAVPMLNEGQLVGAIVIYRQKVRPFTNKQIELVQNFAAQAVIAIENTRLLNELRESLQQQTATADVLKTISSSPGQLAPVFNSMLENATRICGAGFGSMFHFDGKRFDFAANYGTPPALVELQKRRGPFLPPPGGVLDRVLRTKQVAHSADYATEQPQSPPVALGGARSTVAVPMLKDDQLVGGIVIYRKEVRPFSEKEIDLVGNFAAQAVIAIENTRLLNELRQRTDDLSESL